MEFNEKLQALRKSKHLTQEQLAELLYVSRTAISKWESGRGYPSIESLKMIAGFFAVSVDDLLSGDEVIAIAQKDAAEKTETTRHFIFGMIDVLAVMLVILPIFGVTDGDGTKAVSLPELWQGSAVPRYLCGVYLAVIGTNVLLGIAELLLRVNKNPHLQRMQPILSLLMTVLCIFVFALSRQPYPNLFMLCFLIFKGIVYLTERDSSDISCHKK